jgi:hypothetical protein
MNRSPPDPAFADRNASSDNGTLIVRPISLLIFSAILAFSTVYAALRTHGLMGQFRGLFISLGASLSPVTGFVLDAPNFWWIIAAPASAVFTWVASRSRVTRMELIRMRRAVVAALVFGVLVYGLVAIALYSPLFDLGRVV